MGCLFFLPYPPTLPQLFEFLVCWSWKGGREVEEGVLVVFGIEGNTVRGEDAQSQVGAEACECVYGALGSLGLPASSQRPPPRQQLNSQEKEVNSLWTGISLLP